MIRRCSGCGIIYGHKAPFLDTTEVRGLCKDCRALFLERIQKGDTDYRLMEKQKLWKQKATSSG